MGRNVEIKARVKDPESLCARVEEIADSGPVVIEQVDTFFNCRHGRLKLREVPGEDGQLIFYVRPDSPEPAESQYSLVVVSDPSGLLDTLSQAMGVKTVVRKVRALYHIGQTRVHLDEVEGLGSFVELEVVLAPGENAEQGIHIAHGLMEQLGIDDNELVRVAYADLLQEV
ncbi:class IV adenylate cyclase [Candidatus Eisenbacteria bacterium]|uniref:Class IV adenylate cyclase n=1 Tax=Eiseniibacteriota bacterium TaxID=2212470 RepID=A0ABV6YPN6_UNCEI